MQKAEYIKELKILYELAKRQGEFLDAIEILNILKGIESEGHKCLM